MKSTGGWTLACCTLLLLTACDSFSVVDMFHSPWSLTLSAQFPSVEQNAATLLFPTGGTPPYNYYVLAGNLSYSGTLGSVSVSPPQYNAGTSIGEVRIRVSDASGVTADAIVTVRPPPPTAFSVAFNTSPTRGDLTWSYANTAFITGYALWVSTNAGASYSQLAILGNTASSFTQNGATDNYYRLYALSAGFSSLPASAQ